MQVHVGARRIALLQSGFGEVRVFVHAGDRGAAMCDVVGASFGDLGDLVEVVTSVDESAAGFDGLKVLPGLLGQLFGEVVDFPTPGNPVMPTRCAFPDSGSNASNSCCACPRWSARVDSSSVMAAGAPHDRR